MAQVCKKNGTVYQNKNGLTAVRHSENSLAEKCLRHITARVSSSDLQKKSFWCAFDIYSTRHSTRITFWRTRTPD